MEATFSIVLIQLNMGMDLSGSWMKSTPNEIKKRLGDPCIHYNWSGWSFITSFLEKHGVDMSSFSGSNDGQLIPRDVCMIVAETIEKYLDELSPDRSEERRVGKECRSR